MDPIADLGEGVVEVGTVGRGAGSSLLLVGVCESSPSFCP